MSRLATLRASTTGGRSGRFATFGASRTLVVWAATTESSVQVSRKRAWYGWSWNVTRSSPTTSASRASSSTASACAGVGRDEDAELQVVPVVGHRRPIGVSRGASRDVCATSTAWTRSRAPSFASTPATRASASAPGVPISASGSPRGDQVEQLALRARQSSRPAGGDRRLGGAVTRSISGSVVGGVDQRVVARDGEEPASSSSGGVSLSVKPLTPARSASSRYSLEVEGRQHQHADGRAVERDDPARRLEPVELGHAHVHQHDVGPQALAPRRRRRRRRRPRRRSRCRAPARAPSAGPSRTSSKSSTISTRTVTARSSPRARAAAARRPRSRRRAAGRPRARRRGRGCARACRSGRARRPASCGLGPPSPRVGDAQLERLRRPSVSRTSRRRAARVLDRVGQRLLHDAVDGELGARAAAAARVPVTSSVTGRPAARVRSTSSAEPVERGRRRASGAASSTPRRMSISASASVPAVPDPRRGLLGALRVAGQDPAGAARLDDHHADAVRDHVVHLARDPAPLAGDRLLRLALALLGGERRRLVQLGGVARARAHGPAARASTAPRPRRGSRRCSRPWSSSSRLTARTPASSTTSTGAPCAARRSAPLP